MLTLAMIATTAALVLGSLYVLAVRVRDACALHDLAVECQTMRLNHARRLAMLRGKKQDDPDADLPDVEILGEAA